MKAERVVILATVNDRLAMRVYERLFFIGRRVMNDARWAELRREHV